MRDVEQALVRIDHALAALQEKRKHDLMLPALAAAVVEADTLLSAFSFLYQSCLAASLATGTHGVRVPLEDLSPETAE